MTSELQQTRYDQLIRRVGGIIGPGSKVAEALAELFPTLDVENVPIELLWLAGWRIAMTSTSAGASAGNNQLLQLFNPAGSGLLVVPELVLISSDTAQTIEMDVEGAALATDIGNTRIRDTRVSVGFRPTAQNRSVQQAGSIAPIYQIDIAADIATNVLSVKGIAVLAPGTGLTFSTTVQNTSLRISWQWRERAAETAELNF